MDNNKINIKSKKILFLGYGAVAKGVWNYFTDYFEINRKRVVLVDKDADTFTGPNLTGVKKIVMTVDATNFSKLIEKIGLKKGDIIIDLTTGTPTYFFITICFERGFHYINTSIEDVNDEMLGTSIECQQRMIASIAKGFPHSTSAIVTECGQNPGLVQHYVKFALNEMKNQKATIKKSDYSRKTLTEVIDEYKVGTILMSEIDMLEKRNTFTEKVSKNPIIYNTWSVNGYLFEALDSVELVSGTGNRYVKPVISDSQINNVVTEINDYKDVVFLQSSGLHTTLNSICPILENNTDIVFSNYTGKMIHHGEVFEMGRFFGDKAPFMSYVYRNSPHVEESVAAFYKKFPNATEDDLWLYVNKNDTFHIFNGQELIGYDSVGCTIFCGDKSVERIFWCGSILSSTDLNMKPDYTPTIVQVVAGVLSGLSYVLENEGRIKGWIEPSEMDTPYILEKSKPLLGKFEFLEIPVAEFKGPFSIKTA
jgi:homospermidine synthase